MIRDAYWIQRLFDARFRILIGRADPSDYFGAYWLQNVNNSFVDVRQLAQGGLGLLGLLGRDDDLTGAAFSVAIPRNQASRNESVLEVFHRFQVTKHSQLSFGLQGIFQPSNAPGTDAVGVFYARLRTSF